jgi:hypothetical protein
MLGLTKG